MTRPLPLSGISGGPVDLWRCEACGRWSHAKRRPTRHRRLEVVSDSDYGEITAERICGPFRRYIATPTDDVAPVRRDHGRFVENEVNL